MSDCHAFGNHLKLTVRGASHARRMTFTLANFPAGVRLDEAELAAFMERRAPGRDRLSTQRREPDRVAFTEGLSGGVTTGAVLRGEIASVDMRPRDYGAERTIPRPGHADFGQWVEMGRIPTGGGKNSGRLTAPLCAVGGLCLQFLKTRGIAVTARVETIRGKADEAAQIAEIEQARKEGDSVGGTIVCTVTGVPAGLGGALYEGLESELSAAMFAIPGVKGIEFGTGFACTLMKGSEFNDAFVAEDGVVKTATNRQGGILGGRASGMPIEFRVALRPTPTIFKEQPSIDLKTMRPAPLAMKGRHDPCIVRRAVPVVEALTAFSIADAILADEASRTRICLTLTGRTLAEDVAQYNSQRYFTDLVELRVDLLEPAERAKAADFPALVPVPVILTFRRKVDGGAFEGPESERVAFFNQTIRQSNNQPIRFAYVDFEEDFRHDDLSVLARAAGVKVVRSMHDFTGPVPDIVAKCRELRGDSEDVPKIAFMPKTAADVERLFTETVDFTDVPHVLCAMGPLGLVSRVLAVRTHSLWTYASVGGLGTIGHVTPYDLVRTYRVRSITPSAQVRRVPAEKVELANLRFADEDEDVVALPCEEEN
ncbi:MAG: chorismate synthase [Kiritimatiellia bacterium]